MLFANFLRYRYELRSSVGEDAVCGYHDKVEPCVMLASIIDYALTSFVVYQCMCFISST